MEAENAGTTWQYDVACLFHIQHLRMCSTRRDVGWSIHIGVKRKAETRMSTSIQADKVDPMASSLRYVVLIATISSHQFVFV